MSIILSILLTFILWFPPLAFGAGDIYFELILQVSILALFYTYTVKAVKMGVIEYRISALNTFFAAFIVYPAFQILAGITKYPYGTYLSMKSAIIFSALFFITSNIIDTRRKIDDILSKVTLVGFVVSVIGIAQALTKTDRIYWLVKAPHGSFFGPFINENTFACYVSMVSLVTLGSIFSSIYNWKKISGDMPVKRIIVNTVDNVLNEKTLFKILAFSLMTCSVFLSKSRSGIVFFAATLVLFLIFLFRKNKPVMFTTVCGLIAAYLFLNRFGINDVFIRLGSILAPEAYTGRVMVYQSGFNVLKSHPFFGIGFGAFSNVFVMYNYGMELFAFKHLHNDILQLLIEAGCVGFAAISIPIILYLIKFFAGLGRSRDAYNYCIGLSLLSAFFYLGLHSLTDFQLRLNAVSSLAVMLLAVSVSLSAPKQFKKNFQIKSGSLRKGLYILLTAIFALSLFLIAKPFIASTLSGSQEINHIKLAIRLEPGNPDHYLKYARFMLEEIDKKNLPKKVYLKEAEDALDKAIVLDPYKSEYKIEMAQVHYLGHDYEKAFDSLRGAVLAEPNNPRTYLAYTYMLFWRAINENDAEEKGKLMKKGLVYYNMARALSKHTFLRTVIKDKMTYYILVNTLKEEGIVVE